MKFISATREGCLVYRITLFKNDDIIIDEKRYDGIPGLYELIFMKFPNENNCMDDDVQTYKKHLLTTNVHRRGHSPNNQVIIRDTSIGT